MRVNSEEYQNHIIFESLDHFIEFYSHLSFMIMSFMTSGTTALTNIDTHIYSSMSGTLDSIKLLLQRGRINDAFALLRKFHDAAVLNVYVTLYLEDNIGTFIVRKIQNWLSGKDQLTNFRGMTNYIKDSKTTCDLYKLLNKDDRYDKIRDRCNDHAHYNFYRNVMLNDNEVRLEDRLRQLDLILSDIKQIIIMHLAYCFCCNQHYMMASDYTDYLECGRTPPDDSQYWVANCIQMIFDDLIKKYRPDVATYIKDNTSMELE